MVTDIRTIERNGQYFVDVVIDGSGLEPRGPFLTPGEAKAAACQLAALARGLHADVRWVEPVAGASKR